MVEHVPTPVAAFPLSKRGPGLTKDRRSFSVRMARRRLRVAPWQEDPYVALIAPTGGGRAPGSDEIRQCIRALDERGVMRAVTPALSRFEAEPFFQAGFRLFERLHLLACPLDHWEPTPTKNQADLKRGTTRHHNTVLDLDGKAFDGFWRFDHRALDEARTATPAHRFRLAKRSGAIVGYAITGRAGPRGYLQRLAVDPKVQGQGIGTQLVTDSFQWLQRRQVSTSLVNTQETNTNALRLYEHMGYRRQPDGLLVLRWDKTT